MIRIGLDVHGVIDSNPAFFAEFTKAIIASGGELHILTGPKRENVEPFLKEHGIVYTHFYSIVEEEIKNGHTVTYDANGDPWMDGETWNRSKAKYCEQHGIDLHIDDSDEYGKHFKTPFALFKRTK